MKKTEGEEMGGGGRRRKQLHLIVWSPARRKFDQIATSQGSRKNLEQYSLRTMARYDSKNDNSTDSDQRRRRRRRRRRRGR